MAKITYTLDTTTEASTIATINTLLLNSAGAEAKPKAETKAKSEAKPKAETKPAESSISLADFKKELKAIKAEHGEDFINEVFDNADVKAGSTLGRRLSAVDSEQYAGIIATLKAGPTEDDLDEDDLDEDDGLDDLDDAPEITVDAVKVAAKAYAKEVGREEAKAIMGKYGAASLIKISDCDAKQLAGMMKEFTS